MTKKKTLYVPEDLYRMIKETKYCTACLLFLRQLLVIRSPIVRSDHVDEIAHWWKSPHHSYILHHILLYLPNPLSLHLSWRHILESWKVMKTLLDTESNGITYIKIVPILDFTWLMQIKEWTGNLFLQKFSDFSIVFIVWPIVYFYIHQFSSFQIMLLICMFWKVPQQVKSLL